MKDLLSEFMQACFRALGGAMDEAERHITQALEILHVASGGCGGPKPSIRTVRGYLAEAHVFVKNGDSNRAVVALGSALEAIESKPEGE